MEISHLHIQPKGPKPDITAAFLLQSNELSRGECQTIFQQPLLVSVLSFRQVVTTILSLDKYIWRTLGGNYIIERLIINI